MKRIEPPFTAKNLGKRISRWADDLEIAYLAAFPMGCHLVEAEDAYVTARIIGDGVRLVLYPHRTGAGNRHLRVRDEHSKDPAKALALVNALNNATGLSCTFTMRGAALDNLIARAAKQKETES